MSISRIGTVPVSFTCTAATRPSAPVLGQTIMVTDRGNRVEWWDGTNWRYGLSNVSATSRRTAGDINVTSTTAVALDTGMDLVLPAVAGDVIEVTLLGKQGQSVAGNENYTDVFTMVSGSPVNSLSGVGLTGAAQGLGGSTKAASLSYASLSGNARYVLVSGDISGGTVTLRLYGKVSAGTGTWYGAADYPHVFFARNLGPCASGVLTAG